MISRKKQLSEAKPPAAPSLEDLQPSKPNLPPPGKSRIIHGPPSLPLDRETAGLILPRIQDPPCPQRSPFSLPQLLECCWAQLEPPPGSLRASLEPALRGRGVTDPNSTEKGQKSLCSGGQELGELQKTSHREFPPDQEQQRGLS